EELYRDFESDQKIFSPSLTVEEMKMKKEHENPNEIFFLANEITGEELEVDFKSNQEESFAKLVTSKYPVKNINNYFII
ncbi:hypothetical protein Avbf_17769, partial [Armadillidium vulgare]